MYQINCHEKTGLENRYMASLLSGDYFLFGQFLFLVYVQLPAANCCICFCICVCICVCISPDNCFAVSLYAGDSDKGRILSTQEIGNKGKFGERLSLKGESVSPFTKG